MEAMFDILLMITSVVAALSIFLIFPAGISGIILLAVSTNYEEAKKKKFKKLGLILFATPFVLLFCSLLFYAILTVFKYLF
jgi:hypothetical protein